MRNLTPALKAKLAELHGVTPIVIIKIEWASGSVYYAERTLTIPVSAIGCLVEPPEVTYQKTYDSFGQVSSVSIKLDDKYTQGMSFKTRLDTTVIENTTCIIYHWFLGLSQADMIEVFRGKIEAPITWSNQIFSFDAVTKLRPVEVGFKPRTNLGLPNPADNIKENAWPIAFGSVFNVPAVRITQRISSITKSELIITDPTTPVEDLPVTSDYVEIEKPDARHFPRGEEITLLINGYPVKGSFELNPEPSLKDRFTFSANGQYTKKYNDLHIGPRNASDPDFTNPCVLWLDNSSTPIEGLMCDNDFVINLCVKQVGRKCWFSSPWINTDQGPAYCLTSGTIDVSTWRSAAHSDISYGASDNACTHRIPVGSTVELFPYKQEIYVFSFNPITTDVHCVKAYRKGELVSLPLSYYTVIKNDNIGGHACATVRINTPLDSRLGEEWDEGIYVSFTSDNSAHSPMSTPGQIQWLVDTYLDYEADIPSFEYFDTLLDVRYPSAFCLFDTWDVFDLIQKMAWQSRCIVFISGNLVKINYLSWQTHNFSNAFSEIFLTPDYIDANTFTSTMTDTGDIVTRLTGSYKPDYAKDTEVKTYVYENNIDQYGCLPREEDFFIYPFESLVKKSVDFWGYRYSNYWKRYSFSGYLELMSLELGDGFLLKDGMFDPVYNTKAIVQGCDIQIGQNLVSIEFETPYKAGSVVEDLKYSVPDVNDIPPVFDYSDINIEYEVVDGIEDSGNSIHALGSSRHSDVAITSPEEGQVITYQNGQWVNADATGGGGGTPSGIADRAWPAFYDGVS